MKPLRDQGLLQFMLFSRPRVLIIMSIQFVGFSPVIPTSYVSRDLSNLLRRVGSYRYVAHVVKEGYEDGYNRASCEASKVGLLVVGNSHLTTRLQNRINGYISGGPKILAEKIIDLLQNAKLAHSLGNAAIYTVIQSHLFDPFNGN